MTPKLIEIRDRATFIPAIAIRLDPANEAERYLLARVGYGREPEQQRAYVLLTKADGSGPAHCDPYEWGQSRTMCVVHKFLVEHFDEIDHGDVVDVEFILGETAAAKRSERDE